MTSLSSLSIEINFMNFSLAVISFVLIIGNTSNDIKVNIKINVYI